MAVRAMFESELKELQQRLTQMGQQAIASYASLVNAIRSHDQETLRLLLDTDRQMQEMQRSIEARCLYLMTKEQPIARDLRLVSAALKVVTDMERIGDHVTDIAELYLRMFNQQLEGLQIQELRRMLDETKAMLEQAVLAFVEGDDTLADKIIAWDDVIDGLFNDNKLVLMEAIRLQQADGDYIVDCLMVAKYLEKIGDHCVNIGEWTKFRNTGDMQGYPLY